MLVLPKCFFHWFDLRSPSFLRGTSRQNKRLDACRFMGSREEAASGDRFFSAFPVWRTPWHSVCWTVPTAPRSQRCEGSFLQIDLPNLSSDHWQGGMCSRCGDQSQRLQSHSGSSMSGYSLLVYLGSIFDLITNNTLTCHSQKRHSWILEHINAQLWLFTFLPQPASAAEGLGFRLQANVFSFGRFRHAPSGTVWFSTVTSHPFCQKQEESSLKMSHSSRTTEEMCRVMVY